MDEWEVGELALKVVTVAVARWEESAALAREAAEFRHLVGAAVRLADADERRRQVSPLLHPLQSLLHRVAGDDEQAGAVHLALAACYAAIGEPELQFRHLNRACDCAVRVMGSALRAAKKAAARRQRDELLGLLGDRREPLIGRGTDAEPLYAPASFRPLLT